MTVKDLSQIKLITNLAQHQSKSKTNFLRFEESIQFFLPNLSTSHIMSNKHSSCVHGDF